MAKATKKKAAKKKSAKKKPAKKKPSKAIGRPTKYHHRYCRMLINFFDIEPFKEMPVNHYDESGMVHEKGKNKGKPVVAWIEIKREANRIPTLERFAKKIKVSISSIYNWLDENHASFHKEFMDAFTRACELRKWFLIENGLVGCHQHSYAKFVAMNLTDMRDKLETELTGKGGKPIPVSIVDFEKIDPNE